MQLVLQHCCETTRFAILLQKKLKSDGACFTNHIKPVWQKIRFVNNWLTGLNVSAQTHTIAFQLFFAAIWQNKLHVFVSCFTEA